MELVAGAQQVQRAQEKRRAAGRRNSSESNDGLSVQSHAACVFHCGTSKECLKVSGDEGLGKS